jgi:hypothetical protein
MSEFSDMLLGIPLIDVGTVEVPATEERSEPTEATLDIVLDLESGPVVSTSTSPRSSRRMRAASSSSRLVRSARSRCSSSATTRSAYGGG